MRSARQAIGQWRCDKKNERYYLELGEAFPRFRTANQKPLFEYAGFFVLYNLHNFYGEGLSVKDVVFLHPQGSYVGAS